MSTPGQSLPSIVICIENVHGFSGITVVAYSVQFLDVVLGFDPVMQIMYNSFPYSVHLHIYVHVYGMNLVIYFCIHSQCCSYTLPVIRLLVTGSHINYQYYTRNSVTTDGQCYSLILAIIHVLRNCIFHNDYSLVQHRM